MTETMSPLDRVALPEIPTVAAIARRRVDPDVFVVVVAHERFVVRVDGALRHERQRVRILTLTRSGCTSRSSD
jgi:hypothetical protein